MNQDLIQKTRRAKELEISGNIVAAEALYKEILGEDPIHSEALHSLAIITLKRGDIAAAHGLFAEAVKADPNNGLFHQNLGEVSRRIGNLEQAILCGKAATKLKPMEADPFYNLGLAYTDARDFKKATAAYRKAVKINPQHGSAWNNLGSALEAQGNIKSALSAYESAVAINPKHAEAQNNRGALYSEQGKIELACDSFNAAIEANPSFVEAHYNLSSLKKYSATDPHLAFLQGIYAQREGLSLHARIRYAFAMGKALDDIGSYDQAFAAYEEGNRLQRSILPVDEDSSDALLAKLLEIFTPEFFEKRKKWGSASDKKRIPIFIVGMPRSGTTLLEQILSTHTSVYGAGELVELNDVILEVIGGGNFQSCISSIESMSQKQLIEIGEKYLDAVWKLSPKSIFITDKMPANFFYLGLIHLALPQAKIIHAMRDPMDSCFSCYSRLFNDTMDFAYDQNSLGRYYSRYMTLMNHWHQILPAGAILDVSYEEMVSDTEGQARRILKYIGLPWDAKCLEFHKNERHVKTASVAQVRKPIYKSSVARWKYFRKHLQPLLAHVSKYRKSEDLDDLDVPKSNAGHSILEQANPTSGLNAKSLIEEVLHLQGQGSHQLAVDMLGVEIPKLNGDPNIPVFLHLLGISLYRLNRFSEARHIYERSLQLQPNFPSALNSYGFLLQDMGFLEEAKSAFDRAVKLAPEMAMARLNLGMVQLKLGDFENGLENYEARWQGSAESAMGTFVKPECPLPLWNGEEATENQSLLVITEQGFGDTFQYVRYLPDLAKNFRKVGFACAAPTLRLMEWAFSNNVVLFTHLPREYATWDYQCSLMSLPRLCRTRVNTIPANTPYLSAPEPAKAHWRERLNSIASGRKKIGIAWAGRPIHQYDSRRSLSFEQILPLLSHPEVTWVSLQKWAPQEVRPSIPENIHWVDWTEELQDFADTAALVEGLDLVISIDSAMVHLAGALNRPVWMLNRFDSEWRWFSRREDSPWYPSLRIFNQPSFGDWSSVIHSVGQELGSLIDNGGAFIQKSKPSAISASMQSGAPQQQVFSIEQAIQLANQLQVSGRLNEAEKVLQKILEIDSKHSHALHLLGVITFQSGHPILALDLVRQAILQQPDNALYESNLAEMLRQQGRYDDAVEHGKRAVNLDPTMASAYSNLGVALFDLQRYDEAETAHLQALAIKPGLLQSLNNLGSIERARKNITKAITWYRQALEIDPDFYESLTNIGAVLIEADRSQEAIEPLIKVLNVYPESPEALCNLGLAFYKEGDHEKANDLLRRSLQSRPGYVEALIGLARVLHEVEQAHEAEKLLQEVLQSNPNSIEALSQLGAIFTESHEPERAEEAYRKVLEIEPSNVDAYSGLANLLLEDGKIAESESLLRQALDLDGNNLGARFHLAHVKKVKASDENLKYLESMLLNLDSYSKDKKIFLHYALGKSYDDLGDYDKAFVQFSHGASLKRTLLKHSSQEESARTDKAIATFTPELFNQFKGGGNPSHCPIFVLGMPRSGTTLTEQIISSHPLVYGAGELRDLLDVIGQSGEMANALTYGGDFSRLTKAEISQWGNAYIDRIAAMSHGAERVTDKMPANYLLLGLISLILPNAKIVHVKRDPIDTCLSCYTRLFNRHQNATYDLEELGKHYLNYHRIMEHWRQVLPPESFIEIEYESLIGDTEIQAKSLIHKLGLEWNDACLAFYKNDRRIRTASVTQVRQPIYKSSISRWRHYEKYLSPLIEQLKPIL